MEVVQQGITPSTWQKQVICGRCDTKLKISWKDIFIITSRKNTLFQSKRIIHYYIKCPTCGCRVELDKTTLPYVIKEKVYNNMDTVDMLLNFYF